MLLPRILTALIGLPVILAAIHFGGIVYMIFVGCVILLCLYEYSLVLTMGKKPVHTLSLLFFGALMAAVGVEYGFADMVFARAGFHYGDPAKALPTFASVGIGAKFIGIRLDASYVFLSETLGNSFLVSLGYAF